MTPDADVPAPGAAQPLRGKAAKRAQGFERSPPRCLTCNAYVPPTHGRPTANGLPAVAYEPPRCGLGWFAVDPSSICNEWTGSDGSTLDDRDKIAVPATKQ